MLSKRYQERRDQLVADLELTKLECLFIEKLTRDNTAARRVALLFGQYVDAETRSERESLLRLLIETAVPNLRLAMQAAALKVPAGHEVLTDQHLRALRLAAEQGLVVSNTIGDERDYAVIRLKQRLEVVTSLDGEVADFLAELSKKEGAHG